MTDSAARNQVIAALRRVRVSYRKADTAGEVLERELDRLIQRKTRINTASLIGLHNKYDTYVTAIDQLQQPLADAYTITATV